MYRLLPLVTLLVPALAWGADPPPAPPSSAPPPPATPEPVVERPFHHEVSFRGRMVGVPDSILDIWYFSEEESPELEAFPRPSVRGYALGIEYCVKHERGANGIFYFDMVDNTTQEGYWDDREDESDAEHQDGEYLKPSKGLGLVGIGGDFGYEIHFVRTSDTNGNFGLSLIPGAGLGVAILTGKMEEWSAGEGEDTRPAYQRYLEGEASDETTPIPKVLPMVDINLSLRFNFGDRAVLRFEGGFHNLLYYGTAVGLMF